MSDSLGFLGAGVGEGKLPSTAYELEIRRTLTKMSYIKVVWDLESREEIGAAVLKGMERAQGSLSRRELWAGG